MKLHYDSTKQIESVKLKYLDKYRIFKFVQKSSCSFFKPTFRDSAPHNSQSPAQFLNKMTSILKEKVFMVNIIVKHGDDGEMVHAAGTLTHMIFLTHHHHHHLNQ